MTEAISVKKKRAKRERQPPPRIPLPNGGWMFADGSAICQPIPYRVTRDEIERALKRHGM